MSKKWSLHQKQKQFDFRNVPKVHDLINNVAGVIVKDIKEGITRLSQDIHGQPFAKISKKTADRKGHSAPLIDSGKMKEVYVKERATSTKHKAEIGMNIRDTKTKKDGNYGNIHNKGLGKQKKREWFGIGERVTEPLDKMVRQWFKTIYAVKGK